jgi:GNAT superfamily N-acetyltransferase
MKSTPSRSDLQVRVPEADDIAGVAALCAQLGYPVSAHELSGRLAALSPLPDHAVFVARREGAVLGWIHVAMTRALEYAPCAEILGLVVDGSARGGGVGTALVAAAEDWALAQGVSELRVRSRDSREAAHRFYRGLGFEDWKRQLVFRKSLRAPPG